MFRIKITEKDGTPLPETSSIKDEVPVTICNGFMDALMRKIELHINGTKVGSDHAFHPHVATLKNFLSYPEEVANTVLEKSILWKVNAFDIKKLKKASHLFRNMRYFQHEDEQGGAVEEFNYRYRWEFIAGSKEIFLTTRLNHDVFNTNRLLPPDCHLKIVIQRSAPEFALIAQKEDFKCKIVWLESKLNLTRVTVDPSVVWEMKQKLCEGNHLYLPFSRTDARAFEIPIGSRHYRANSIFSGVVPSLALLTFLPTESVGYGDYSNNPVRFETSKYKVNHVQFFVNEKPVLLRPYTPDFENKQYIMEYMALLEVLGLDQNKFPTSMNFGLFGKQYGVFAVSFEEFIGMKDVVLSLEVQFASGTKQSISGLFIPQYKSYLEIDNCMNVTQFDY